MKKIKIALMTALMLFSLATQAQVGIGVAISNINPSAQLDVSSTTKGFLPPRMTEAQRNDIPNPAAGLVLWCSNCGTSGEIQVYNGTAWTNMVGGTAQSAQLVIGQSYQGGKIAYILKSGDNGYDANINHGLIAATSDQSIGLAWWNGSYINTGATATAIGTGLANTDAIIFSQGNTVISAAKICRDYRGGGYSDWFLPSKDELNNLFVNRYALGVFAEVYYWSSTENGNGNAWYQGFYDGTQSYNNKATTYYVRAVRAF